MLLPEEMKVLVIAPYAQWTPHFETDLEIVETHLDAGDQVHLLYCRGLLQTCKPNPDHRLGTCLECIGRAKSGIKLLNRKITVSPLIGGEKREKYATNHLRTEFQSLDDLRQYKVDGFDIGMAVLSSLVSGCRDPEPNLNDPRIKERLLAHLRSSFLVYRSVRTYIRTKSIDVAYVFNGRLANLRGAFRAAQAEGITCFTHDRGCDFNHYQLFENKLPHDLIGTEKRIWSAWDNENPKAREAIGGQFFEERFKKVRQNWITFTEDQELNVLPDGWSDHAKNIVIFTSSEDEFVAIGDEWVNPLYSSQLEALKQIVHDLVDKNLKIYIRMHPNLKEVSASYVKDTMSLVAPNLMVISPASEVDSYELLNRADRILTFGSMIGIEATYWGKASILAGPCFYRNLGGTYNPSTHHELLEYLLAANLDPKPREKALIYGYYEKTKGERFKYFEGLDVWDGLYRGEKINALPRYKYLSKLVWFISGALNANPFRKIRDFFGI